MHFFTEETETHYLTQRKAKKLISSKIKKTKREGLISKKYKLGDQINRHGGAGRDPVVLVHVEVPETDVRNVHPTLHSRQSEWPGRRAAGCPVRRGRPTSALGDVNWAR